MAVLEDDPFLGLELDLFLDFQLLRLAFLIESAASEAFYELRRADASLLAAGRVYLLGPIALLVLHRLQVGGRLAQPLLDAHQPLLHVTT